MNVLHEIHVHVDGVFRSKSTSVLGLMILVAEMLLLASINVLFSHTLRKHEFGLF